VSGSAAGIEIKVKLTIPHQLTKNPGCFEVIGLLEHPRGVVYSKIGVLIYVLLLAVVKDVLCLVFRTFGQRELPRVAPQHQKEVVLSQEKKTEQAPYHSIQY
jgi:hypothetical protein